MAHYYTSPGLTWDAMLKKRTELELPTDPDVHLFVEKGIHGGLYRSLNICINQ